MLRSLRYPEQSKRYPSYAYSQSVRSSDRFGFLLQWPTMLTLTMFPVLTVMYLRLALAEERQAEAEFGDTYRQWAAVTPRFIPYLIKRRVPRKSSRSPVPPMR